MGRNLEMNGTPPEVDSDEALYERFVRGDHDAFGELMRRYSRSLLMYIKKLVQDVHLAEDVLQEVFRKIAASPEVFDLDRRFKPWVYAVATNRAYDALRRKTMGKGGATEVEFHLEHDKDGLWNSLRDSDLGPFERAEQNESLARICETMLSIPENGQLLVGRFLCEYSYRELARIHDIPIGTVKSRLNAGVTLLRERLSHLLQDSAVC